LAVYFIAQIIFSEEEKRSASRALGNTRDTAPDGGNSILKFSRPFFSRYIVPMVEELKIDDTRKILKKQLANAGLTDTLTPDELFSFKLFLIIAFPGCLLFMKYAWGVDMPVLAFPASMVIGYFYPDRIWLPAVITARQEDIRRNMPFVVDLLALSTEAGLDFMGAIQKVVEKARPSPLVSEMELLLKDIKLGSARAVAMRNFAWRIGMQEINSFVAVLISADEMGASIGKILRQQSEQIRHERFMRAEKAGAKATQLMLLPMILFIVPAIFLIIFGPFILSFMGGGASNEF
jgi:tight adherence protein C